ncbi:hypothetical protein PBY51_018125 [Eleginops maclovinus]|uniref:Uncharacterized protein n=1 Tax=Eleginops maclovinus TaxID=56733 RepID=A0AAN7XII8_ELEMC|nr:hypothetical protein PBY51_018125 [Eleginops maclovinus]
MSSSVLPELRAHYICGASSSTARHREEQRDYADGWLHCFPVSGNSLTKPFPTQPVHRVPSFGFIRNTTQLPPSPWLGSPVFFMLSHNCSTME